MAPVGLRRPSLLLLPQPPSPATSETISAAYHDAIQHVFSHLQSNPPLSAVLFIAIEFSLDKPKSCRWRSTQLLLARLYTLLARTSADSSISSDIGADDPRSIDARVVLVNHSRGAEDSRLGNGADWTGTTIRGLEAFAEEEIIWETIYHPASESGYALLHEYVKLRGGQDGLPQTEFCATPGGLTLHARPKEQAAKEDGPDDDDDDDDGALHQTVCLGGTFDHLHPGHKLLLHAAALLLDVPRHVSTTGDVLPATFIVGITGDELLKSKKYASELQSWPRRAASVLAFLATLFNQTLSLPGPGDSDADTRTSFFGGSVVVRCVNISDPFGPTITEQAVDAIVVSGETRAGGKAINDRRAEKGWRPLRIYEIDVLDGPGLYKGEGEEGNRGESFEDKISSTAIRKARAERKESRGFAR